MRRWLAALILAPGCSFGAPSPCEVVRDGAPLAGRFEGADADRAHLAVRLVPVLRNCGAVTDLQFLPGSSHQVAVVDQHGTTWWADLDAGTTGRWFEVEVQDGGEKGLLGLAIDPGFATNGRLVVNGTFSRRQGLVSRVIAYKADPAAPLASAPAAGDVVLEVEQPFGNHNAGGLAFGPDGRLYVGWGDGGAANDPRGHGQNRKTLLGSMVRLDLDAGAPWIPPDNPFVGRDDTLPEIWAIGLRNPWRISFAPDGRLVAGDVGQNTWEEITFVVAGGNAGWNVREGRHCFAPPDGCDATGMTEPIWEYPHSEGVSVTGGYVASEPAAIANKYVFADYGTGRLWALDLPPIGEAAPAVAALGRFSINPATFGRDARGRLYVANHSDGTVYRIDAP